MNTIKSQKTILIAEDEEFNFLFLEQLLSIRDYNILHAKNGKEALDICRNDENISLVFMDIRMPIMNGYDATVAIKKIRPELPVIAHTAYAREEDLLKGKEIGFDDYITKPVDPNLVFAVIDKNISI